MEIFLVIGGFFFLLFIYALFSERLFKWSISGPMVFAFMGLIFSFTDAFHDFHIGEHSLEVFGQIALIVILFTDATNIPLKNFWKVYAWPVRMLFIALPITMAFGAVVAMFFFPEIEWEPLVIMALILSPTDAALGQTVVQSEQVPLKVRETINVESGLNDGLALPPIIIFAGMLIGKGDDMMNGIEIPIYIGKQIILGPIIGALLGWLGSKLINWAADQKFSDHISQGVSIVAISIFGYVLADEIGGNGYMAAFCAGLFFNATSKEASKSGHEFGEYLSQPLILFVFFVFGANFTYYWPYFDYKVVIFSVLSLTLFRMLPIVLSLIGTKIPMRERVFMAWFGPRGIASILYFLLMYNHVPLMRDEHTIWATVFLTVALSIFLHGITAVPYANWIGKMNRKNSEE